MEVLDTLGVLTPIMLALITLVIVLAKMHADVASLKDKVRALFELWNKRD